MLGHLFEVTRGDAERGYTLEVRVSNIPAIRLYERLRFRIPWLSGAVTILTTEKTR